MQERFARFFPRWVANLDKIGQHAGGFESGDLSMIDRRKESLYGIRWCKRGAKEFLPANLLRAFCRDRMVRISSSCWREE